MKRSKRKSEKTSYDRAQLFRQAFGAPSYAEGGSAGRRGARDQVKEADPKEKNRFIKGLGDVGKFMLNQAATPFETVMGWNFYDPSFSDTKFGSTVGQGSNIMSGFTSAATDIAGTAFLGPTYGAGKSTLTQLGDIAGLEDQTSGQILRRGGHARNYKTGGPTDPPKIVPVATDSLEHYRNHPQYSDAIGLPGDERLITEGGRAHSGSKVDDPQALYQYMNLMRKAEQDYTGAYPRTETLQDKVKRYIKAGVLPADAVDTNVYISRVHSGEPLNYFPPDRGREGAERLAAPNARPGQPGYGATARSWHPLWNISPEGEYSFYKKDGGSVKKYANGGPPSFLEQENFQQGWNQGYAWDNPYFTNSVSPTGFGFTNIPTGPHSTPADAPAPSMNTQGGMGGTHQQDQQQQQLKTSMMTNPLPQTPMDPLSLAPLQPMGDSLDQFSPISPEMEAKSEQSTKEAEVWHQMLGADTTSDPATRLRPSKMGEDELAQMMKTDKTMRIDNTPQGIHTGEQGGVYYDSAKDDSDFTPRSGRLKRWKEQLESQGGKSDWASAIAGTDRTAYSLDNPRQWAGVTPFIQSLGDQTLSEKHAQDEWQRKVKETSRVGNRGMQVYGQDGTSAGITGDTDPTTQMKLNALGGKPSQKDWSNRIGNAIAQLGDLGQKAYSGFAGGAGPEWAKHLGTGEIPKADMGGSIGSFYGGVNAAFLANRDDGKHLGYGYNSGGQPPKKYGPGGQATRAQIAQARLDTPLTLQPAIPVGNFNMGQDIPNLDPGFLIPPRRVIRDGQEVVPVRMPNPNIKTGMDSVLQNALFDFMKNSGKVETYRDGGMAKGKDTVNLEELPGDVLKVPGGFDGAFELTGGNLHSQINPQTGRTGVPIITPGEGEEVEIEAEKGEILDVDSDTQETFVVPRKFASEYKKNKEKQGKIEGKLERHAKKKADGIDKEKLDPIQVESLQKELNNTYIRQDAIRQQILEEKQEKEAEEALLAAQQQQAQPEVEETETISESETITDSYNIGGRVSIPFAMGMANYGRGIRNTKDWYDTVAPGGQFEPINPYTGVMDESVSYLKDQVRAIAAAEENAAEREAMNINKYNAAVQNKVNSASIEDARMRANAAVRRRDAAARRDSFGKQRMNMQNMLAQMMGKGNQLDAMGEEKKRQNEQMLVGDYYGALAKDYDELYQILGAESKYQQQNALNKLFQEQLDSIKADTSFNISKIPTGTTGNQGATGQQGTAGQTGTQQPATGQTTGQTGQTTTQSQPWTKPTSTHTGGIPAYASWDDVPGRLNPDLGLDDDGNDIVNIKKIIVDGQPMIWDTDAWAWTPAISEGNEGKTYEELKAAYKERTGMEYTGVEPELVDSLDLDKRIFGTTWEQNQPEDEKYGMFFESENGKYYDELGEEISKEAYDNRVYERVDEDNNAVYYDKDGNKITEDAYYDYYDKYSMWDDEEETDEEKAARLEEEMLDLNRQQTLADWEEEIEEDVEVSVPEEMPLGASNEEYSTALTTPTITVNNPKFKHGLHSIESAGFDNPYQALPGFKKYKKGDVMANGKKSTGKEYIYYDSNGKQAVTGTRKRISSAAGKYQFLWKSHKDKIKELTGIETKQGFLNSPNAQEQYMDYWTENTLVPEAKKLRAHDTEKAKEYTDEQLQAIVHFLGLPDAKVWLKTGKQANSENNVKVEKYLETFKDGQIAYEESLEEEEETT